MKSLPYSLLATLCATAFCFLFFAATAYAQQNEYQPLTGIPGVTDTDHVSLAAYVNALFIISIALGAMLAVIQIAIGGFTYMMTDVVTKKGDATARITGALLGLGILLATFVVLYTINPQLTNLNVLTGADRVNLIAPPDQQNASGSTGNNTDGSGVDCPVGYKARVSIVVGGSNSGGYECVPTSCPPGTREIKNPNGNNPAYICGEVSSGTFLWSIFAENNAEIAAAESKCATDGGETASEPQADQSVFITCTSK